MSDNAMFPTNGVDLDMDFSRYDDLEFIRIAEILWQAGTFALEMFSGASHTLGC